MKEARAKHVHKYGPGYGNITNGRRISTTKVCLDIACPNTDGKRRVDIKVGEMVS